MPTDRAAARRARYRQRRRKGLCTRCGEKSDGKGQCRKCRGNDAKAYRAKVGTPEQVEKPPAPTLWELLEYDPSSPSAAALRAGEARRTGWMTPERVARRAAALLASYGYLEDADADLALAQLRKGCDYSGPQIVEDTLGPGRGAVVPAGTFARGGRAELDEEATRAGDSRDSRDSDDVRTEPRIEHRVVVPMTLAERDALSDEARELGITIQDLYTIKLSRPVRREAVAEHLEQAKAAQDARKERVGLLVADEYKPRPRYVHLYLSPTDHAILRAEAARWKIAIRQLCRLTLLRPAK